jgi:hypothetical protein
MNFKANTQEKLNIQDGSEYLVEYKNKDYFNGEETIEKAKAKAILNDGVISFIIPDPMGMERFISEVRVLN